MAMRQGVLMCIVIVLVIIPCMTQSGPTAKPKKPRKTPKEKGKVNVKYMYKRLKKLEKEVNTMKETLVRVDGARGMFADDPPCPNGVEGFTYNQQFNSCYLLEPSAQLVNWTVGQFMCQTYHPKAHLVAIETEEEQHYLKGKWMNERGIASVSRFWTDGTYRLGRWLWDHINRPVEYEHWIPTTTHDDDRFTCIAVYSNEGYFWGDVACWYPHMVTCEINL